MAWLEGLGVEVVLGERPVIERECEDGEGQDKKKGSRLVFPGGRTEEFDLIVSSSRSRLIHYCFPPHRKAQAN